MFLENFEVRSGAFQASCSDALSPLELSEERNIDWQSASSRRGIIVFEQEALEALFEADDSEWEERMSRTRYLEPKGPHRQNDNGHRYGGDKSWQQHRCYGIPCVVIRQAADERYWRQLLQEEVAAYRQDDATTDGAGEQEEGYDCACRIVDYNDEELAAYALEAGQETGGFNIASGETELMIDLGDCTGRVSLRYSADKKTLTSAHGEIESW